MRTCSRIYCTAAACLIGMGSLFPAQASLPPVELVRISDSAWYDGRGAIPVLHTEGSIEDVARDHGRLAARLPGGLDTIKLLATFLDRQILADRLLKSYPSVGNWITKLFDTFVIASLVDHAPEPYERAFAAFAKEAGIEERIVHKALALPDAALWALALVRSSTGTDFGANFGCTSVIWDNGPDSVLHGRNLDYMGVGTWEKHPLLIHIVPREGLAHVALTSVGVHATGITAMNEANLTVAVHQLTVNDTSRYGTPIAIIAAEIARTARSIDDAITIVKNFPRAAGWVIVVSQGHDRAAIEMTPSQVSVRRSSQPFFFQTNHSGSSLIVRDQIWTSTGGELDTFERAERLLSLKTSLKADRKHADVETVAKILSDRARDKGQPVLGAGTIDRLDNVHSVIFDASKKRIWVATAPDGHGPNEGRYSEIVWANLRSSQPPKFTGRKAGQPLPVDSPVSKARSLLRRLVERDMKTDDELAESRTKTLEEYSALIRSHRSTLSSGYWPGLFLRAAHAIRREGNYASALEDLDLALEDPDLSGQDPYSHYRLTLVHLLRGRLSDLLGQHDTARTIYLETVRLATFDRIREAAQDGLKNSYTASSGRKTAIDWAAFDLFTL